VQKLLTLLVLNNAINRRINELSIGINFIEQVFVEHCYEAFCLGGPIQGTFPYQFEF